VTAESRRPSRNSVGGRNSTDRSGSPHRWGLSDPYGPRRDPRRANGCYLVWGRFRSGSWDGGQKELGRAASGMSRRGDRSGTVASRSPCFVSMGEFYRLISTRRTQELMIATMYVATKAIATRYVPTAPTTTSTTPAER
jgi:hypothetical protein